MFCNSDTANIVGSVKYKINYARENWKTTTSRVVTEWIARLSYLDFLTFCNRKNREKYNCQLVKSNINFYRKLKVLHTSDSIAISLHKVYFVIRSLKCKFIKWVSKVIRRCFVFALLRSVIGLENWRHSLNQSDAKLKQTRVDRGRFPRLRQFACFTCSSHWGGVLSYMSFLGMCCCQ